ncbi:MAG: AAA family ATPase [Myxococcota bacterium]
MIRRFADVELDAALYQVRRRGRPVRIEPKVFDVLAYLIEHCDRVVSKQELLDTLWPGEAVSDSVLPRCIAAARRAVGDTRGRQALIATVHGRGYRFVGELEPASEPTAPTSRSDAASATEAAVGDTRADFVGRGSVLKRIDEALQDARGGATRTVFLVGEPGIGKTRTCEEVARRAAAAGMGVLHGRCFEGEGAPAYWPWVQVLRGWTQQGGSEALPTALRDAAAEAAAFCPDVAARFPDLPTVAPGSDEQTRFRLFDSVTRLLAFAASQQPLLVLVDDLHWADRDSLRLLRFLARSPDAGSMLLLATYRDVEVRRQHPLSTVLGEMARETRCDRIELAGLSAAEVEALLEAHSSEDVSAGWVEAVHGLTNGNPFFVQEMARLLEDRGEFERVEVPASLELPQGVRDAIGRRLSLVSEECNRALQAAAVLGRGFETALLAEVTEVPNEELLELLGEALAAQLLVEAGIAGYEFAHALTRQVLHEELSVPQRVRLHARAGDALARKRSQGRDDLAAEVAHHHYMSASGGGEERAIASCIEAARQAERVRAHDEAAGFWERALEVFDLAGLGDPARRVELLLALGDAQAAAGLREPSRARFLEAARGAESLGRSDLIAEAAVGARGFGESGSPPHPGALALLESVEATGERTPPALRARVLARLTGSAPHSDTMARRDALAAEAWSLAQQTGDPTALADALAARFWASLGPDRIPERAKVAEEALTLGRQGDLRFETLGYDARYGYHAILGDGDGADRDAKGYLATAEQLRMPIFRFLARLMRGGHEMSLGHFGAAERDFEEARQIGRGTVGFSEPLYIGQRIWLAGMRGESFADAGTLDGFASLREAGFLGIGSLIRTATSMEHIDRGDAAPGQDVMRDIRDTGLASLEPDEHWLTHVQVLVALACRLGDREAGTRIGEALLPKRGLVVMHDLVRVSIGTVETLLAMLAILDRRPDEARTHLAAGMALERRAGLMPATLESEALGASLDAAAGDTAAAQAACERLSARAREIGTARRYDAPRPWVLEALG